jgi:hypothetical protein
VDMVLLDWTRMGRTYCVAGAVLQQGAVRIVRPLLARNRDAAIPNIGWPAFRFDTHSRWEVFELIDPECHPPQPPHLEDVWVRALRSRGRLASPSDRRAILEGTLAPTGRPLFGTPLTLTYASAYLQPGTGERSLTSVVVPGPQIAFRACRREGAGAVDHRVTLELPALKERTLPVKDHCLLRQAEMASGDPDGQARALTRAVRQMGEEVVVRVGLSRAFQATPGRNDAVCWLMADGFFSRTNPEP